jgi:peptidyl-dipeptidase Dcp
MKKQATFLFIGVFFIMSFISKDNPFYKEWQTPYGMPDFDKIKIEHYMPAFKDGMAHQLAEIEKIANNPEQPTFKNTAEAWEKSDELLARVSYVFFNLASAHTNKELQAIQKEVSPLLSAHNDNINLNEKLFTRIKTLYDNASKNSFSKEQLKLLERKYKNMVRGGANLNAADKEELKKINEEITILEVQFSDNVLSEDNAFEMLLEEKELTGLPENVKAAAALAATEKGHDGKWLFTLHKPSLIPFIQFSDRRELREKMFTAYIKRGDNNNANDNKDIINKIVNLRIRKSKLMNFETHAHYVLEETMAKTPQNVFGLLDKVWPAALQVAKKERDMMQKIADEEGADFKIQASDWWYYAEKIRIKEYDLNEEEIRPYLKIDNVINGSFILAKNLFGISFEETNDLPKYHEDVKTYVVKDTDGRMIGIYLSDWFYRSSKRGGAWMNEFRPQSNMDRQPVLPIITNVGNFTKPAGDVPSLLTLDEVETLFHEFGHALHGLLSQTTYPSLSGTNVPRDFVEFPSQVLENWVLHPEMLKLYAFHYQSGEVMPADLIQKIKNSDKFNQGFQTVEYMAAAYLDLAWHTLTEEKDRDVNAFEDEALKKIDLIPEIISRYRTTNFRHIVGGYDSGYYSYLWSEVLDADTFEAFKEKGIFDKETARNYRTKILARGGTMDAMEMFVDFRGREPEITPYLERKGLILN